MADTVMGHGDAGSSDPIIEIKIKTMDSQTYKLQVDKQMPVPALKDRIASVTGVVSQNQRLICRGKVLKDDQLLSAYHVEDGHTLHLVVREPIASSSESLPADSAFDQTSSRGRLFQVAPGIVVETFNMPGQGDRGLPDLSRMISAVLGSIGVTNTGNGSEAGDQIENRPGEAPNPGAAADTAQILPEQSGMRSSNDSSGLQSAFGIPAAVSFGSVQASVIPDAVATLSQYLGQMRQEFLNNGRGAENSEGVSSLQGNEAVSSFSTGSESALPSPASLAVLLSSTRQMLNQLNEECLALLATQLQNQGNLTDPEARARAQSGAWRSGILLQNLGAFFLELGRTVSTLRLGQSPSEAVVNAGPAVFISPSGPNPLMVQPLPFQPGASFGTPLSGTLPSGSGLIGGLGAGLVPRRIDIQIRRVAPSTHQTEAAGTRQSSGQRHSSATVISGVTPINQPTAGTLDAPSSNSGAGLRVSPFRTTLGAVPDLNSSPPDAGSLASLYQLFGRSSNTASGNSGGRAESQLSGLMRTLRSTNAQQNVGDSAGNGSNSVSTSDQRESVTRTIDINILSAGGIPSDQNPEGQIPPSILQFLRGLFPGGEFHVESVSSEGTDTGASEQPPTSSTVVQEAEPEATEEGLFFSRMLQQIMPLISQDSGTDHNDTHLGGDTSSQREGSTSSNADQEITDVLPAEDSELGASRQRDDHDTVPPSPKRQKME